MRKGVIQFLIKGNIIIHNTNQIITGVRNINLFFIGSAWAKLQHFTTNRSAIGTSNRILFFGLDVSHKTSLTEIVATGCAHRIDFFGRLVTNRALFR